MCDNSSSSCCALSGPPTLAIILPKASRSLVNSRRSGTLFVPVQPRMFRSQDICLLPTPRRPSILLSFNNQSQEIESFARITWPKYESFRTFIHLRSSLSVFALRRTSELDTLSVQAIRRILRCIHISNASNLFIVLTFRVHASTPYSSTDQT